jgi:hypothetical protein
MSVLLDTESGRTGAACVKKMGVFVRGLDTSGSGMPLSNVKQSGFLIRRRRHVVLFCASRVPGTLNGRSVSRLAIKLGVGRILQTRDGYEQ